jgi:hypothetical protein
MSLLRFSKRCDASTTSFGVCPRLSPRRRRGRRSGVCTPPLQWLPTARGNYWTRSLVTSLRANHEIACHSAQRQAEEGWLNLSHAARSAGVSNRTLRIAIERGYITAERPIACGPWVINRKALTNEVASTFIERARIGRTHPTVPSPSQTVLDLSIT